MGIDGHTDADRHAQRPVNGDDGELALCHKLAHAVRSVKGRGRRRIGKNDGEFLAAVARHEVAFPLVRLHRIDHTFEDLVADRMAKGVVDPLEVVDVEHGQRELVARTRVAMDFPGKVLLKMPVVERLRQVVDEVEAADLLILPGRLQRIHCQRRKELQRPHRLVVRHAPVVWIADREVAHHLLGADQRHDQNVVLVPFVGTAHQVLVIVPDKDSVLALLERGVRDEERLGNTELLGEERHDLLRGDRLLLHLLPYVVESGVRATLELVAPGIEEREHDDLEPERFLDSEGNARQHGVDVE